MSPSVHDPHTLSAIQLPAPTNGNTTAVFAALQRRKTTRVIREAPLPLQTLSNLLWAACGVNRSTGPCGLPGRTAASASDSQEIDIYIAVRDGAYVYDALAQRLEPVVAADLRIGALTPGQENVNTRAPIQLIYVVDIHRLSHTVGYEEPGLHDPEVQKSYYYVDTGLIAGNVYLFAAAEGLAAWFHNCDKVSLAQQLRLRTEQKVLFAQSIGYPGE